MNTNNTSLIVSSIILGTSFFLGIQNIRGSERFVTVKGVSEREVKADLSVWKIPFSVAGNSIKELQAQSESQLNAIVTFLKKEGVKAEEISFEQPIVTDKSTYSDYKSDSITSRFTLIRTIILRSGSVDKVQEISGKLDELLKFGIVLVGDRYSAGPEFLYTKLNEIKPSMVEDATKAARTSALQFAKDSNSLVGKIRRANQGLFAITDKDQQDGSYQSNTSIYKKIRVVSTIDFFLE